MNPEPPPIADPHSTAPVLRATKPNIWTATIAPLVLWLLGVPLVLLGSLYVAFIFVGADNNYPGFDDHVAQVRAKTLGLALILIGAILIYFGSRLWKRRKTPPS